MPRRRAARPICATRLGLNRAASGGHERGDEQRHRQREKPLAGFEGIQTEDDLQVDGEDEERPQQDELLRSMTSGTQLPDPQQRAVEQRVPSLTLASLLPLRKCAEKHDPGKDQERDDREAERRDLLAPMVSAPRGSIKPHSLLLRIP